MINQQVIKSENKKMVYTLISDTPGISRVNLASVTKLSKTTVSALVDELIQDGYILDQGAAESSRQGRKPNSLCVNKMDNAFIVINWRAHTLQIALLTSAYEIIATEEDAVSYSGDYIAKIKDMFDYFLAKHGSGKNILGVCIVIPGIIDSLHKRIISMVLPISEEEPVIDKLRMAIPHYPLAFFNDTACFAYAENTFGDNDVSNYIYLNINEGVGASLIQDGNFLRGATGMGIQFGHFSVDRDGELCICGNRGCLEHRIGEMALSKRAEQCGAAKAFETLKQIQFKDVGRLAAEGNPDVLKLISCLSSDLSFGLGNLITVFHPESIVIGGMGRKLGGIFLDQVRSDMKSAGFQRFVADVSIDFAKLREEAVFQGAAKYYMDTHYDFMEDMSGRLLLY